ncbi:NAD(P)H-binding protein, partial [Nostoc linckia]|uniref:NAD(P)H-binding protein n=1 Tax=Nostoc linckia TaxID=92942 RepID=UPI000C022F2F
MAGIVIIGATGLIGSHLAAHLSANGHRIIGVARHVSEGKRRQPDIDWVGLDLGAASPDDWSRVLVGADAVVNCAGALQDSRSDNLAATHDIGLRVLVSACEAAGIRRFVHFSAMGVDQGALTPFSDTKRAGEAALVASRLDWIVLRPSVVLGAAVYGASALIRGLAALPLLPVMPETGLLRPVALEDVIETVQAALAGDISPKVALDLAGPDCFTFTDLIALYRRWLGFTPARTFAVPGWLGHLTYRLGDLVARLGWRSPVRS